MISTTDEDRGSFKYSIQADTAMGAVTQLLHTYRKQNPDLKTATFDFEDGSKVTIVVKASRLSRAVNPANTRKR